MTDRSNARWTFLVDENNDSRDSREETVGP